MIVYEKYIVHETVHEYSIWKVQTTVHERESNMKSITGKQYMKIVHEIVHEYSV